MNYDLGLETLKKIAETAEWYQDFINFEAQLRENLQEERRFGGDERSRNARARIIDQLNQLTFERIGVSFNDLCLGKTVPASVKGQEAINVEQITVLFLSADPTDATRLRLGQELREIQEKLQMATMRHRFRLEQRMSARVIDVTQALLDTKPHIVHFSGHGTRAGELALEDDNGYTHEIHPDALAALFKLIKDHVKCVILNACYSEIQAKGISEYVEYVIGMNAALSDNAAIAFSVGFYQALGAGKSIEDAYNFGCVQIRLQSIPEHLIPILQ